MTQKIELIDSLTKKQEAEFPRFRKKWLRIGESKEPINKKKAREAALECYDLAWEQLSRPDHVIFVQSPFQLFYARPIWNRMADWFEEEHTDDYNGRYESILWFTQPLVKTEDQEWLWGMRYHALAEIVESIVIEVKDTVIENVFKGNERAFWRSLALMQRSWLNDFESFMLALIEEAKDERGSEIYGQNETWLCFYEFMEWAGCKGLEGTHGLQELAKHAGWWIPYENVAVVSDRPKELHLDSEGRLHSHSRPAIEFRDGWKYYASHGMELPAWIIEYPKRLTVEAIDGEENVEIRRVMLEIYGMENYLENGNAELIDRDPDLHIGELYKRSQEDDEDIFMLKMLNSTPNPDGTFKVYVIRVPPTMKTAKQAVAWSYGFDDPEEYNPVRQS